MPDAAVETPPRKSVRRTAAALSSSASGPTTRRSAADRSEPSTSTESKGKTRSARAASQADSSVTRSGRKVVPTTSGLPSAAASVVSSKRSAKRPRINSATSDEESAHPSGDESELSPLSAFDVSNVSPDRGEIVEDESESESVTAAAAERHLVNGNGPVHHSDEEMEDAEAAAERRKKQSRGTSAREIAELKKAAEHIAFAPTRTSLAAPPPAEAISRSVSPAAFFSTEKSPTLPVQSQTFLTVPDPEARNQSPTPSNASLPPIKRGPGRPRKDGSPAQRRTPSADGRKSKSPGPSPRNLLVPLPKELPAKRKRAPSHVDSSSMSELSSSDGDSEAEALARAKARAKGKAKAGPVAALQVVSARADSVPAQDGAAPARGRPGRPKRSKTTDDVPSLALTRANLEQSERKRVDELSVPRAAPTRSPSPAVDAAGSVVSTSAKRKRGRPSKKRGINSILSDDYSDESSKPLGGPSRLGTPEPSSVKKSSNLAVPDRNGRRDPSRASAIQG